MKEKIKILIANSHEIYRNALEMALSKTPNVEVCFTTSDIKNINTFDNIDILLSDINSPVNSSIENLKNITEKYPGIKIIALSMSQGNEYLKESLNNIGIKNLLQQSADREELNNAINAVYNGNNYISRNLI